MTRLLALITRCFVLIAGLTVTSLHAEVIDIDSPTLQKLIEQGVAVIDVRRAEEWSATGVIEGSELMTFFDAQGRYDAVQWLEEVKKKVNTEAPLILICHSGVRSSIISKWLGKQIDTVYNVKDGIVAWKKEQRPTVAP